MDKPPIRATQTLDWLLALSILSARLRDMIASAHARTGSATVSRIVSRTRLSLSPFGYSGLRPDISKRPIGIANAIVQAAATVTYFQSVAIGCSVEIRTANASESALRRSTGRHRLAGLTDACSQLPGQT